MPQRRQLWQAGQENRLSWAHSIALTRVVSDDSMRNTRPRVDVPMMLLDRKSPSSITHTLSLGPRTTLTGETWPISDSLNGGWNPPFTLSVIWYPGTTSGTLLGVPAG